MEKEMKAISLTASKEVALQNVPTPMKAEPGYLVIKMEACGINAGDKAFIAGVFPRGTFPVSQYGISGVSGAGIVIDAGDGVPDEYKGKKVTVYRSLKFGADIIGTWSQYAHLHYHHCAILPDDADMAAYSGSLVNIITPYAFLKQITEEGHKGIISTAGTSATGIAMLGICQAGNFPLISIVRDENSKKELEELGAKNVVAQADAAFKERLKEISGKLEATAIFDGVGGELLNRIIDAIPNNSTIYTYGYLGGNIPLSVHTGIFTSKGLTIKGFGNFRSKTVQDPQSLEKALTEISQMIHMPHFKTKIGKKFKLEEIGQALQFSSENGGKAALCPFE